MADHINDGGPAFPATFAVHTPQGPVPCCVAHARALIRLGQVLGAHFNATRAADDAQCSNCRNEAAARSQQKEPTNG